MIYIILVITGFLALITIIEACRGYYQCKYSDRSHCCVVEASLGAGYCPGHCNGGDAWLPECISQTTSDWRRLCS
ncbi:hypothetical protein F5882DRAFT_126721 [Hyaloscypha sp. PMI_1271]|nr:hypothetical protein F5882DRAFT_126721 [Hyaloscypha sp. PMI_1271]